MAISSRGANGDPLALGSQSQLVLQSRQPGARSLAVNPTSAIAGKCVPGQPVAQTSGTGFLPGSQVRLYVLPGTVVGTLPVDATGAFAGSVPVPVGVTLGSQTLQANGFALSGQVRSVSLGVQVTPVRQVAARTSSAQVFFAPMSPELTAQGRRALDALVRKAGKAGQRAVVVGFVQQTSSTNNDQSLSTRRAQNVAAYLK
ncbi:MAG: OmpA family protein, partial [Actinomycetales bacterium]|nr:OmpA family protein [Actinomycetales bacterium]